MVSQISQDLGLTMEASMSQSVELRADMQKSQFHHLHFAHYAWSLGNLVPVLPEDPM